METYSAKDAKNSFGDVMMKAQQAPVCINKNGKPAAVMMSAAEYENIQVLREQLLHQKLEEGLQAVKEGRILDGPKTMEKLRKKYFDGNV